MNTSTQEYTLRPNGPTTITIPKGARILTATAHGHFTITTITLYAEINPDNPTTQRTFTALPTGAKLPIPRKYITTLNHHLTAHVYEIQPKT